MNETTENADEPKKTSIRSINHKRVGREIAMQFLYQLDLCGCELNTKELDWFWRKIESTESDMPPKDIKRTKKFATRIIEGVLENKEEIDRIISEYSIKWHFSRIGVIDRNILRVAIFEMFHCLDIPPIVSINEAIEISKDFATDKSGNFINGILNRVKDSLSRPAREAVEKS